jgi:hypothetical protein
MLRDKECDIAINVDEDCFITSKEAVMRLVEYVVENGIANAGAPDGGSWVARVANPLVTNPFFNVFNLNLIRDKFSKKDIETFDYAAHWQQMEASYPHEMLIEGRKYTFAPRNFEPYYPFFLWLAYNTKTLYLPTQGHPDSWTTILCNHEGKEMCRHTWLARFYSVPAFIVRHWQPTAVAQQERINRVIDEAYTMQNLQKPVFHMKDKLAFVGNKMIRWTIKIPQRIAGWPKKWRQKWSKRY